MREKPAPSVRRTPLWRLIVAGVVLGFLWAVLLTRDGEPSEATGRAYVRVLYGLGVVAFVLELFKRFFSRHSRQNDDH